MASRSDRHIVAIGVPASMRGLLERSFPQFRVDVVHAIENNGFRLEMPTQQAVQVLEACAESVTNYESLLVVLLPYAEIGPDLASCVDAVSGLGGRVLTARPNDGHWPSRPPRFDERFTKALLPALRAAIAAEVPTVPELDQTDVVPHREVTASVLRGLISHSKMGPNNHSHEDDFWKSRAQELRPKERHQILMFLLRERLIARKKNKSMGGDGWVYWIDDVAKVRQLFPELHEMIGGPERANEEKEA